MGAGVARLNEKLSSLIIVLLGASSSLVDGNGLGTPAGVLVGFVEDSATASSARFFPLPAGSATIVFCIRKILSAIRFLRVWINWILRLC
jgi:hypothetical protein